MTWAAARSRRGRTTGPRLIALVTTGLIVAAASLVVPAVPQTHAAPVALTVTPLTWNVIGLDSNSPATGPNRFPVGARVCNAAGADPAGNVSVDFAWDSANALVNLRPGSLGSVSIGSLAAGSCADAYFEVEVTKTSVAFDTTRRYHITATDSTSGATASTPQPRELFVERLISQNRNGVDSVKLNGTSIPAGGAMTMVVGNTYTIELAGHTATQGYNQLEGFINFPNTIFQTLAVSTTYSADTSPYVSSPSDKMYADACGWENDPDNPNYRSCVGGDGKTGGTVVTTYTVKILSGAGTSESLNSLLYDFSGSSYHYNADFSVGGRIAQIVGPASVTISKAFVPRAIQPGGTSTMTFKLTNPTTETFTGVNFTDTLLGGLVVAGTPAPTYSGCGAGTFSPAPVANATSLSFSGATLLPNSVCTITVDVSGPAGTYPNTTGNLFINGSTDTGNAGQDTLTVSSAPPCVAGQTLARWSVPNGTIANPPDTAGGLPTVKAANVVTATAAALVPASTSIITSSGQGDTTSWRTWGHKSAGQYIQFVVDTSGYSGVTMSFYVSNPGGGNAPNSLLLSYSTGGPFTTLPTNLLSSPPDPGFAFRTQDFTGLTSTTGNTTFRLAATGAANDQSGANLDYDNISFTGCGIPAPAPTIVKAFSPDPIVQGAASTLTFTISNTATGNRALSSVAFSDVLPAGLSVADSSSTACNAGTLTTTGATRSISLTGGTLAAGATCTFSVAVTGTDAGRFDNVTGYVSSTESGASTNYATASLTVVAPPAIGKSFSPSSILTGDTSTLAFDLTNPNTASTLTGLGFTNVLPAGVTVASSGPTSVCGGTLTTTAPNSISFSGGSLTANASCTFSVTVTGATSGTKFSTTSVISSSEGGPGNIATATLIVNDPVAVIDLNKQASTDGVDWFKFVSVPAGDDVFYRFSVYNGGDVPFTTISVDDPALVGTSADPALCVFVPPLVPGDTATCVTGPITATTGLLQNTATASGEHSGGTKTSLPSTATYGTPGLSIDKSAAQTHFSSAGDVVDYSYVVTNSGFTPLLGPVTVADDKSTDETCPAVSTVGDLDNYLDPGEAITCGATYTVQAGDVTAGSVTNIATATTDGITSPTDSVTVLLQMPAIDIVKSASPSTVTAANQVVDYSFVVTNTGNVTLSSVGVSDPMVGLSAVTCPQTSLAPTIATTCTASYTVTLADMDNGTIANTATASGTPPTGPAVTDTSSTTVTATPAPAIDIVKSASPSTVTAAGQTIDYSFDVTNTGNVTLSSVGVTDPMVGLSAISCPQSTLAPSASTICTATYSVTLADMDSGSIANTATASGTPPSGPAVTDTSSTTVTATPAPSIDIVKSASPTTVTAANQVVDYSFVVTNTGNVTLSSVGVTDPMVGLSAVTCPQTSLAPTVATTCTATYTVTLADMNNGSIANTATASGTPPSGPAVTDTSSTTVTATPAPSINMVKSASPSTVTAAGQTIEYSFVVTNTGNVTLSSVGVTDPMVGLSAISCPQTSLAPTVWMTCTATYTVTLADMNNGSIANTATASGTPPSGPAVTRTSSTTVTAIPAPSIDIVKSASPSTVTAAGQTIDYSFVVTNTGNVTLSSVGVTDPMVGLSAVTCPQTSLAPTVATTCTATYSVTLADMDNGSIANTATASGTPPSGPAVTDTSSTTVTATPAPAIDIVKSASPTTVTAAGQTIDYSFDVTNTGNVTLSSVGVTDPMVGLSAVTCPQTSLAPTVWMTCTATYTVTLADMDSGSIANTATATGTPPSGPAVTDTSSTTVTATPAPSINMVKSASPSTVTAAGQTIDYSFVVTNTGNVTLSSVGVTDPLPGLSAVTCPQTSLAPTVATTCTATYTVTLADMDSGSIANTATATGTPPSGPAVTDTSSTTVTATPAPSINMVKSASPSTVTAAGQVVDYSFVVTNTGNVTLSSVGVTDPMVGLSAVTCPQTSLAPTVWMTCTATYTVTLADMNNGSIANTATATGTPPSGPAVTRTSSTTVTAIPAPSIDIVKSASPTTVTAAGQTIDYSFVVTNTGNVTLSSVGVTDPLPGLSAVTCPQTSLAPTVATTCTATYTVTLADMNNGSIANTATASGTPPSGPAVTDTSSTTVTATPAPAIDIVKSASPSTVTAAGQTIDYSFDVTNTGNVTLSSVGVTDPMVGLSAISCPQSTLAPGASTICTATYTVTLADMDNGSIANTATASGTPPSGPAVTDTSSTTVTATPAPSINIVKSASPSTVTAAGQTIDYSFVVTNTGNVTLSSVGVTDPLPGLSAVTCPQTSLAPTVAMTCTATYPVTLADMNNGSIANSATATGTPPSGPAVTRTSSTTVTATPAPSINLVKSASPSTVTAAGQAVDYSFDVTNTGNVTLTSIAIGDPLPGLSAISCPQTTLAPGASTICTATYTVTLADMNNGSITNTATAAGRPPTGLPIATTSSTTVTASQSPAITLTKATATTSYTAVGQQIGYTITATNSGNVTISDVTITDPTATMGACPPTTLAPGQSISCDALHTVTRADIDAGVIINTARVSGDSGDVVIARASNTITVPRITPTLPSAGSDIDLLLIWAAGLVAAGLIFRVATRRRHAFGSGTASI